MGERKLKNTVYDLISGQCSVKESVHKTYVKNLYLIPTDINLAGAEIELADESNRNFILKKEVDFIQNDYDFILIDCPPSLSILTLNALTTSNTVLVPLQCEFFALEGLSQLWHTINIVEKKMNSSLKMEGIVFTMYDARTNLASQVMANVKASLNTKIFNTVIPRNIKLAEAPSHGLAIIDYDSKSVGSKAYRNLAKEVIEREATI